MALALSHLLTMIEDKLSPLAPEVVVLSPTPNLSAIKTPGIARVPTAGHPVKAVVGVIIEANTTSNRKLDREGISPHLMLADTITLTLAAMGNALDPKASRNALLDAEERVLDVLYADDFARNRRLTYDGSTRNTFPSGSGSSMTVVMTFNRNRP